MSVSELVVQASEREGRREARKRERHAERQRLIMQSARSLLVQQGLENFTIAQVAAVASVSKPAVYYYFDSKEDLVYALSLQVLGTERERLARAVGEAESAVDALAALVRTRIDFYLEDRDSFRILYVWGPMLGLEERIEASRQYEELVSVLGSVAQRLTSERQRLRAPGHVEIGKIAELAWAMSQGILTASALAAPRHGDSEHARELRDSACRWLLDSLVL